MWIKRRLNKEKEQRIRREQGRPVAGAANPAGGGTGWGTAPGVGCSAPRSPLSGLAEWPGSRTPLVGGCPIQMLLVGALLPVIKTSRWEGAPGWGYSGSEVLESKYRLLHQGARLRVPRATGSRGPRHNRKTWSFYRAPGRAAVSQELRGGGGWPSDLLHLEVELRCCSDAPFRSWSDVHQREARRGPPEPGRGATSELKGRGWGGPAGGKEAKEESQRHITIPEGNRGEDQVRVSSTESQVCPEASV